MPINNLFDPYSLSVVPSVVPSGDITSVNSRSHDVVFQKRSRFGFCLSAIGISLVVVPLL